MQMSVCSPYGLKFMAALKEFSVELEIQVYIVYITSTKLIPL